ncbi:class I SAM-dependent methyltransferase [Kitasatospora paracochleata]|uniref:SAM-dependent methyltransferase n=1 Tax=Kitasatospora paracochleata TaxID=58354 RepID=A0ABT1IWW0_9ACTN|nr:class I SAM-dependent methyltransferase [Kitasatospora paracochleata]MCP2309636.1 SAM-dependent methyltransferase [Kitasatospora paracochleata]
MELQQTDYALSFGSVADTYDAARPSYPDELFTELERLTGRPLEGADVLDVGAGTGIATRLLHARGARVVAVEPSPGMAARLSAVTPQIPVVKGVGDDLPFHDASADLITYAQAFHWTDPDRSVPEAMRVLRPGGALALWWNVKDRGSEWLQAQEDRLAAALPGYHYYGGVMDATGWFARHDVPVERVTLRWERRIPVDQHLADLASRSYFAVLDEAERERLLAVERSAVLAVFPDGTVTEPFALDLFVVTRR